MNLSNELSNELDEISVFEIARSRLFHFEQFWGKNVGWGMYDNPLRTEEVEMNRPTESMLALRENSPKKQDIKKNIHKNHIHKKHIHNQYSRRTISTKNQFALNQFALRTIFIKNHIHNQYSIFIPIFNIHTNIP